MPLRAIRSGMESGADWARMERRRIGSRFALPLAGLVPAPRAALSASGWANVSVAGVDAAQSSTCTVCRKVTKLSVLCGFMSLSSLYYSLLPQYHPLVAQADRTHHLVVEARHYVEWLEQLCEVPVTFAGTGPSRLALARRGD